MTEWLLGQTGSRRASDSSARFRRSIGAVCTGCIVVCLAGCGGGASTTNSTTSNEDIAAFIEENPEYGDVPPAAGKASKSAKPSPLGLER